MEKIILVHYIATENMNAKQFKEATTLISKNLTKYDDIISYIIPTKDIQRVECINPVLVSDKEYENAKAILEKAERYSKIIMDGKLPRLK